MSYFKDLKEGDSVVIEHHMGEAGVVSFSGKVISNKYGVITCEHIENGNIGVFYTKDGIHVDGLENGWLSVE